MVQYRLEFLQWQRKQRINERLSPSERIKARRRRKVVKRKVLILPIATSFSSYVYVVNFIYLTTGKDSQNVAENSHEGAGPAQFTVRHLA